MLMGISCCGVMALYWWCISTTICITVCQRCYRLCKCFLEDGGLVGTLANLICWPSWSTWLLHSNLSLPSSQSSYYVLSPNHSCSRSLILPNDPLCQSFCIIATVVKINTLMRDPKQTIRAAIAEVHVIPAMVRLHGTARLLPIFDHDDMTLSIMQ